MSIIAVQVHTKCRQSADEEAKTTFALCTQPMSAALLIECKYGSSCYQKDPAHRAAYSHPCQYGTACYRKDPAHLIAYTHSSTTPQAATPPPVPSKSTTTPPRPTQQAHTQSAPQATTPSRPSQPQQPIPAATFASSSSSAASGIAGKNIVFTGTFAAGVRHQVEGLAAKLGAHVQSAVTSTTDFVVVGSVVNGGSSKELKAAELGTELVAEADWDKMVLAAQPSHASTSSTSHHHHPPAASSSHNVTHAPSKHVHSDDDEDEDDVDGDGPATKRPAPDPTPQGQAAGPSPLHALADGEFVDFQSAAGGGVWRIKHTGDHYYCTCPSWRNQNNAVDRRTCKHLREYLGGEFEEFRVGSLAPMRPGPR